MFDKIKRLGSETAIYGISTILGRFLNFLLVPLYTNVLAPADYGVVTYVYSLIAFANVLYSYGLESAYFKYSSTLELGTARQNFSTPFISLVGSSVLFSLALLAFASPLSAAAHLPRGTSFVIPYAAGIMALDAMAIIPFAALRMERKAARFAAIKFAGIGVNVGMNILLLVVLRTGVEGIFVSGLVSSALTLALLMPVILHNTQGEFHPRLWVSLLRFALPYVPAGLATMAVQVADRPILRALTDDATVGVYQANYRLGIFMMLVVSMYDYAWRPFYFSIAKEPDCKAVFARVLTYVLLLMSAVFVVLALFIDDIVTMDLFGRHIIHARYWSGLSIVPVVLAGYVFLGISTNLSAGIYIEKKTHLLPITSFVGAGVNIGANYLLIPSMGMMGAAWATLLAYAGMAGVLYIFTQRVYPVRYEYARLAKIVLATAAVALLNLVLPAQSHPWLLKTGLLVLYVGSLSAMKFFEPGELAAMKRLLSRIRPAPSPDSPPLA